MLCLTSVVAATAPSRASECSGNPHALGTSRVLTVEPADFPRLGTMQYPASLPLADKEVVLTFDDGPLPPYSTRVLGILAAECVKATYFLVGRMARQFPDLVRRIAAEGHTVGTHSESHPLTFHRALPEQVAREITTGIASTQAALGNAETLAPFFRIPGLLRSHDVETYLASQGLITWSADFPADDWKRISAREVVNRALSRIEARRKGILLLHDIQPATVLALPALLKELKARGYRIVHVVPAASDGPTRPLEPPPMLVASRKAAPASGDVTGDTAVGAKLAGRKLSWPRVLPDSPSPAKLAMAGAEPLAMEEPAHRSGASMFLDFEPDPRITGWATTAASPGGWHTSTLFQRALPPKRRVARKPLPVAAALQSRPNVPPRRVLAPRMQPRTVLVQQPVMVQSPTRGGLLSVFGGRY
jgi:peptidoglycan/xylan/chitin deacetylase (PgdA/CDA1 family)